MRKKKKNRFSGDLTNVLGLRQREKETVGREHALKDPSLPLFVVLL